MAASTTGSGSPGAQLGPRQLGRYELVCELGKSQIGALFAGVVDGTEVMVRRVQRRAPVEPEVASRVAEAARWAAEMQVEGWVPVRDVVEVDDEIAIVSAYAEGESLRTLLRQAGFRRAPIAAPVAVRVAEDVLEALESARELERHAPGCAWPDSVLVGTDGRARLLDLGLAQVVLETSEWAAHPDLVAYAAPERADDSSAADARTDVFTTAVVLWEMLANQRLFPGITRAAITQKLLSGPILRLDSPKLGSGVGAGLADVVARALERDPEARFQSAAEMLEALRALGPEAMATPAEVSTLVEQLGASTFSLRRRALEKALKRSTGASPAATGALAPARAGNPRAEGTLLGVAPPPPGRDKPRSPPVPPVRPKGAAATLLGVPPPLTPPMPSASRLPRPPPPPPRARPLGVDGEPNFTLLGSPPAPPPPRSADYDPLADLVGGASDPLASLFESGSLANAPVVATPSEDRADDEAGYQHDSISNLLEDGTDVGSEAAASSDGETASPVPAAPIGAIGVAASAPIGNAGAAPVGVAGAAPVGISVGINETPPFYAETLAAPGGSSPFGSALHRTATLGTAAHVAAPGPAAPAEAAAPAPDAKAPARTEPMPSGPDEMDASFAASHSPGDDAPIWRRFKLPSMTDIKQLSKLRNIENLRSLPKNQQIVLGVVSAMTLLLLVSIVVGAIRGQSKDEEEAQAAGSAAAKAPPKPASVAKSAPAAVAAPAKPASKVETPEPAADTSSKAVADTASKAADGKSDLAAKPAAAQTLAASKPTAAPHRAVAKKPVAKKAPVKPKKVAAKKPAKKKPATKAAAKKPATKKTR